MLLRRCEVFVERRASAFIMRRAHAVSFEVLGIAWMICYFDGAGVDTFGVPGAVAKGA